MIFLYSNDTKTQIIIFLYYIIFPHIYYKIKLKYNYMNINSRQYKQFLNKTILFIIAYSPLLLIISIKTFAYKTQINLLLINQSISLPIISIFFLIFFLIIIFISYKLVEDTANTSSNKYITVNKIDEKTDTILSYLFPYIISIISLKTTEEFISVGIILLFIFIIYFHSEIIYINPIFMLLGYKVYNLHTDKDYIIILSKKNLHRYIGQKITVRQLSTRFYVLYGD